MPSKKIAQLNPEQEALMPVYWKKWKDLAICTDAIDKDKAAEAVKNVYPIINLKQPEIFFFDSPYAAIQELIRLLDSAKLLGKGISMKFHRQLFSHICSGLENQLDKKIWIRLHHQPCFPLGNVQIILRDELEESLTEEQFNALNSHVNNLQIPMFWAVMGFIADYCISVLNCHCDRQKWKALQLLIKDCGLFFPYESLCLICDRPRILSFDEHKLPHAEGGSPAIQYRVDRA
ncbi:MAG TPA: hypothetical protein V6D28_03275 [Leptolyngbyaceae cyanobacterium]